MSDQGAGTQRIALDEVMMVSARAVVSNQSAARERVYHVQALLQAAERESRAADSGVAAFVSALTGMSIKDLVGRVDVNLAEQVVVVLPAKVTHTPAQKEPPPSEE